MGKPLKIDITSKITATFKGEYLALYCRKLFVGKYYMSKDGKEFQLEEGYTHEKGKIYHTVDTRREERPSVDVGRC